MMIDMLLNMAAVILGMIVFFVLVGFLISFFS